MAASLFDSPLFAKLFAAGDVGKLFTDSAEVRAMLLVEGTLAKVQGALGVIPEESAAAISRAAMEVQIDASALATATAQNGVPVPALVAAFREEMNAPEHAQFVHWGATTQDILDTALMLRIRRALEHLEADLSATLRALSTLAEQHAELPMTGRTWGQAATPISFGSLVARWGAPLLTLHNELPALRDQVLLVSLSGAAGNSAALGPKADETRAALADALGLKDPARSWHTDRTPITALAAWLTRLLGALGKMGEDIVSLSQSGIEEVQLGGAGASSTMPQKQNPVAPSAIVAAARFGAALNSAIQGAALHRGERDGAALMTEWLSLPQLCLSTTSALDKARGLAETLSPNAAAMAAPLTSGLGLIYAEALSFALAAHMPRPEAQAATKALCQKAQSSGTTLRELAATAHPDVALDAVFNPSAQLGLGPTEARAFTKAIAAL